MPNYFPTNRLESIDETAAAVALAALTRAGYQAALPLFRATWPSQDCTNPLNDAHAAAAATAGDDAAVAAAQQHGSLPSTM